MNEVNVVALVAARVASPILRALLFCLEIERCDFCGVAARARSRELYALGLLAIAHEEPSRKARFNRKLEYPPRVFTFLPSCLTPLEEVFHLPRRDGYPHPYPS